MLDNNEREKHLKMKNIKGIYTFIENEDNFKLCDYEIGILMISVMKWAKLYGPTKLFTNQKGFDYLTEVGIIDLWGEVDKELLEGTNVTLINTCSTGMNHIDVEYCGLMEIKIYSLTKESYTQEIHNRLLNNLSYLYKTKGTQRGIKALLK